MTENVTEVEIKDKAKSVKIAKIKRIVAKVLIYTALVIFALWILAPFSMVIITSFKTRKRRATPNSISFQKSGLSRDIKRFSRTFRA